jgi:multidrug transporter EmrE-like cation transporter
MSPFVSIFLSIVFSVAGQLMLKEGMNRLKQAQASGSLIVRIVLSPWVIVGMLVYGFGTLFWILALSKLDLSLAYPFGSLSYVGIIIGSYLFFKEKLTRGRLIGIAIIVAGILIIGQSQG